MVLIIIQVPLLGVAQTTPLLVPFRKGGLWGYSDTTGKMIIQPQFTEAGFFKQEDNLYFAEGKINGKKVIISSDGKFMEDDTPASNMHMGEMMVFDNGENYEKQDDPSLDRNGLHGFRFNRKTYTLVSSPVYEIFYHFFNMDNCAFVSLKSTQKIGAVDKSGNILIPFEYEGNVEVIGDKQQYVKLKKNGKYGIISLGNKQMVPFVWEKIEPVNEQRTHFLVKMNFVFNLIDINNKGVYPTEIYDAVYSNGLILASYNNSFGYLNGDGKIVIPFNYLNAKAFGVAPAVEGFAWVRNKAGDWFFIDKKGREYYAN